jgi:hypothetical protein
MRPTNAALTFLSDSAASNKNISPLALTANSSTVWFQEHSSFARRKKEFFLISYVRTPFPVPMIPRWCKLRSMFFMVIERFKPGSTSLIGERFKRSGRMLPEGVTYHASWVDSIASRCFQIMEAANPDLLRSWASHWDDLIDFEIVPVLASADFWASVHPERPRSGPSGHRAMG